MPNHVHGVIVIDHGNNGRDAKSCVSTAKQKITKNQNKFGPQSKNLSSIIRGFKIGVTKYCRRNTNIWNIWQPRFYDRIIRNEQELNRIRKWFNRGEGMKRIT